MAPLKKTSGFCIRQIDFSETSQIVTFFTRDEGRMSLMAKGSRRKKSPTQGRIDLFCRGEMVYIAKRPGTLNILTEFKPDDLFEGLRDGLDRAYQAFYVAELLDRGMQEGFADPAFYDFCVATLGAIAAGGGPVAVMVFETHYLDELGVAPQVGACLECDAVLSTQGEVAYSLMSGGGLCRECAPEDAWRVPAGALAVLDGLRRASPATAGRISIAPKLAHHVREILKRSVVHALELEPRMLRLV